MSADKPKYHTPFLQAIGLNACNVGKYKVNFT